MPGWYPGDVQLFTVQQSATVQASPAIWPAKRRYSSSVYVPIQPLSFRLKVLIRCQLVTVVMAFYEMWTLAQGTGLKQLTHFTKLTEQPLDCDDVQW